VLIGANGEPYLIDLGSVRLAEVKIDTRKDVSTPLVTALSVRCVLMAAVEDIPTHTSDQLISPSL
jgi:hypothetical protein